MVLANNNNVIELVLSENQQPFVPVEQSQALIRKKRKETGNLQQKNHFHHVITLLSSKKFISKTT